MDGLDYRNSIKAKIAINACIIASQYAIKNEIFCSLFIKSGYPPSNLHPFKSFLNHYRSDLWTIYSENSRQLLCYRHAWFSAAFCLQRVMPESRIDDRT
jgi:hypothetical protein